MMVLSAKQIYLYGFEDSIDSDQSDIASWIPLFLFLGATGTKCK